MATSFGGKLRDGSGSRAFNPRRAGGSAENVTSISGSPDSARTEAVTARLNGSEGFSGLATGHPRAVHVTSTFAALSGRSSPKQRW